MITAVHTLVYSDDPTATRAFFKDVLRWPFVSEDDEGDPAAWLIFGTGPSELGVHPTSGEHDGTSWTSPRHHAIAMLTVPGADDMLLYEPRHAVAYHLEARP